jgi:hypothetical protein
MATSQNAEQFLSHVHPVDLGNDDVDVDVDDDDMLAQIKPMPPLEAGILFCDDGSDDAVPNVDGAGASVPASAQMLPSA